MAKELNSGDVKIEQKPDLAIDPKNRVSDIVTAEQVMKKDYLNELAFNEEPVTVLLQRRAEKNAPSTIEIWNNGKGCEIWDAQNKRWMEITHVPVGLAVTMKRKYLAILASAKQDRVETTGATPEEEGTPRGNRAIPYTSSLCAFSVIADSNPRGHAWLSELLRRNY